MAEITEVVSKEAIKGIKDLDRAITSTDDSLNALLKRIEDGNAKLKGNAVTFKDLNNAQKQQKKTVDDLSASEKRLQQLRKQNAAITEDVIRQRVINAQKTKELTSKVKEAIDAERREAGSIDALRAANKKLLAIRNATSNATEKGRKKIDLINKKLDQNNAKIKANVSALEKQKMSIGGYTQGITSALTQLGLVPPAATQATGAVGGLTKGFKGLRLAIMSTGIGALIIALGSLVAYFQSTEEGAAKLQKILSPFKILFGNLKDLAADLGEGIVGVFENPKQAISDLWDAIKQNFVNRIQATTKFIGAFGNVLQGIWELDTDKIQSSLKDAGNAYVDMITGVENTTGKVQESITGFVKETVAENEKNTEVINRQLALDKQRRAFKIEEAKLLAEIAEQRLIANDDTNTAIDQQNAINKAIELNTQLANKRKDIEQEDLELLKLRASFSDSDAETLDEIADKEAQIITLKKTQADLERSLLRRKTTIDNKLDAQIKKEEKILELKRQQEIADLADESIEEDVSDIDDVDELPDEIKRGMAIIEFAQKALGKRSELREIEKQEVEDLYASGLLSYEEYQAALTDINERELNERKQKTADTLGAINELAQAGFQIRSNFIEQELNQIRKQKAFELQLAGDNADERAKIEAKFAKKEAELNRKKAINDKIAALFDIAINTAVAISSVSPVVPLMILAGAFGAIQAAVVASQPIPQFAKGTDSTPSGEWIAGEAGRELIKTRSGEFVMANQPTLFSGLQGAKVYTNKETESIIKGYDSPELMQDVIRSNERVARAIENQPIYKFETSKRKITEHKGRYKREYLNKKLYGV